MIRFHIPWFVFDKSGSSSFGRAVAFQASGGRFEPGLPLTSHPAISFNDSKSRCSSVVEHFLGKEEVKGSIPFNGSIVALAVKAATVSKETVISLLSRVRASDPRRRVLVIIFKFSKHN